MQKNPLRDIHHDDIERSYRDRNLARLSDIELFEWVIEISRRPKRQTTSYSLHIGMETMARFRLLAKLPGEAEREWARKQAVAMASTYERLSEDIPEPAPSDAAADPEDQLERLLAAIAAGEVDDADAYASALARTATTDQVLAPLANATLAYLGAAAHASIFLGLTRRIGVALPTLAMLPNVARGLAEDAEHRLRFDTVDSRADAEQPSLQAIHDAFYDGLVLGPRVGPAKNGGILATVENAMQHPGPAQAFDDALGLVTGLGELSRFRWDAAMAGVIAGAARLMIDEVETDAKYYWTHCLTIPQGVWALAPLLDDRLETLRIAAAMAAGFRATRGRNDVEGPLELPSFAGPLSAALIAGPRLAAGVAWRTPIDAYAKLREQLAFEASARNDAHLVKYVLACLDCATMHEADAPLFHASAAYLTSIWVREIPADQLLEHLQTPDRARF